MAVQLVSTHARRGLLAVAPTIPATGAIFAPAPAQAAFPGPSGLVVFHADRSLFTVKAGGGQPTRLPEDVPGFGGLSVSADGTQIAYDDSHALHLMDADGAHERRLTPPGAPFSDRSRDGRRIAYTSQQQVWVSNADGSGAVSLTPPVVMCPKMTRTMSGAQPDWSPDGHRIVFTGPVTCANSRGTDVWVMNADGSGQADLTADEFTDDAGPVFSPDGATIAFTRRDASDAPRLMTIPGGGGAVTAVSIASSEVGGPVWARAITPVRVTAKLSAKRGRLVISGAVKPAESGRVTVTITRSGHRVATKRVKLSHRRFKLASRPRKSGRYRVVATLPAGHGHLEASSRARTLKVEP